MPPLRRASRQDTAKVEQWNVSGYAVEEELLGKLASKFMEVTAQTQDKLRAAMAQGNTNQDLALVLAGDDTSLSLAASQGKRRKRQGQPVDAKGTRLGLPKAVLFARTNIARGHTILKEMREMPKSKFRREALKVVDAHIRDLEYRLESLRDRALQPEDEAVPRELSAMVAALTGMVSVSSELLRFWRDGNPATALAGVETSLNSIEHGDGRALWQNCRWLPPYAVEEIVRLRLLSKVRSFELSDLFGTLNCNLIVFCCPDGEDTPSMRQAVQYRLVEQVMKVLAVEVVTETQWKEVLQTICRVVCPELSRTRKLCRMESDASVLSDSMDLVPTAKRVKAECKL